MYIRRTVISNMLTPFHTLKTEPTHVWPPSLTAQNRTATVNKLSKGFSEWEVTIYAP